MTVRELKDILDKYDDNLPVVVYTSDKNYVIDIFIEPINIRYLGNYDISNRQATQRYYDVETSFSGEEAVLISVEPSKKRF
jgi:hypothetical protein